MLVAVEPPGAFDLLHAPLAALRFLMMLVTSCAVRAGDRVPLGGDLYGCVRVVRFWYAVVDADDSTVVLVPILLARPLPASTCA